VTVINLLPSNYIPLPILIRYVIALLTVDAYRMIAVFEGSSLDINSIYNVYVCTPYVNLLLRSTDSRISSGLEHGMSNSSLLETWIDQLRRQTDINIPRIIGVWPVSFVVCSVYYANTVCDMLAKLLPTCMGFA
jgi:hypothetical protein